MSRILVTGGTGFLGRHLLTLLVRRGEKVRVLSRVATPELDELGVEVCTGSLLDSEAVGRALKGVKRVYHLAGLVSRDPASATEMYRLHVDGTRLLLELARAAKVERVVVASTSGTIAVSRDPEEFSTEESPWRYELVRNWPYYLSKIYQEKLALDAEGPEVVLINPSLLLGPGDSRLSSTGDVLKFLKREVPVVPSGGLNFVDARDAAAGAILAMEQGKAGQRYLLGGANWSMGEVLLPPGQGQWPAPANSHQAPRHGPRFGARIGGGALQVGRAGEEGAHRPGQRRDGAAFLVLRLCPVPAWEPVGSPGTRWKPSRIPWCFCGSATSAASHHRRRLLSFLETLVTRIAAEAEPALPKRKTAASRTLPKRTARERS